jgi:hypothetical protein
MDAYFHYEDTNRSEQQPIESYQASWQNKIDSLNNKCLNCGAGTATNTRCDVCNIANYCCSDCRKNDWKIHKLICTSNLYPEKRMNGKSVYAILFDESPLARFVEISVPRISLHGESFENPFVNEYLHNCDEFGRCIMNQNPFRNGIEKLENAFEVRFRENFLYDKHSKRNETVHKLTRGLNRCDWRGPIVILKLKDAHNVYCPNYIDMNLKDLNNLVDFFQHYDQKQNLFFEQY